MKIPPLRSVDMENVAALLPDRTAEKPLNQFDAFVQGEIGVFDFDADTTC